MSNAVSLLPDEQRLLNHIHRWEHDPFPETMQSKGSEAAIAYRGPGCAISPVPITLLSMSTRIEDLRRTLAGLVKLGLVKIADAPANRWDLLQGAWDIDGTVIEMRIEPCRDQAGNAMFYDAVMRKAGQDVGRVARDSVEWVTLTTAGLTALRTMGKSSEAPCTPRRGSRRKRTTATSCLTALQRQALELYGKHNGKVSEVAKEMGISHPTASRHIKVGQRKIEQIGVRGGTHGRTQRLPTDRRGQADV